MIGENFTRWQTAVLAGLHRYSVRHGTRLIPRLRLIGEELEAIALQVGTKGITPKYTLSRVLQEFRVMGLLHHIDRGVDLLLDRPITAEAEDYPDTALDIAIGKEKFIIEDVPTGDETVLARRRRGQSRLRVHVLANYDSRCALCDVADGRLLIASHIVRWADDAACRGKLSNTLCLCKMHDALFESGFIGISDSLDVLRRPDAFSKVVEYLQNTANRIRVPRSHPPAAVYLLAHRRRTGFESPA